MQKRPEGKRCVGFLIKDESIELLEELTKEVNQKLKIKLSKSGVIELLIQDATAKNISRSILT